MEDASISTAYTNSHHTSDNASSSQSTYITEQAQHQKARDKAEGKRQSTAQSSDQQPKQRGQQNQHHQWLHHQHIRSEQHCQHHKGKTALKTTSLCKKPLKTLQKRPAGRPALFKHEVWDEFHNGFKGKPERNQPFVGGGGPFSKTHP